MSLTDALPAQFELTPPPSDAVSALRFSPSSLHLLVSSWDKNVYLYAITSPANTTLIATIPHRAPVLDVCWGASENEAFSVGLDYDVRRLDLSSSSSSSAAEVEQTVLSTHGAPASRVVYSREHKMLVSSSWDRTMHIHLPDQPQSTPSTIPLPNKPFALALSATKLVLAMSARQTFIYDLKALAMVAEQAGGGDGPLGENESGRTELDPWQRRESSLRYMTRAVACMHSDLGYATSSIEGRVAVEWFAEDEASQAKKYAFKCHRQPGTAGSKGAEKDGDAVDVVYPVNALAFHPVHHGTFASGGGDGVVSVWDAGAKKRVRQYAKLGASVVALDWSHDGKYLAMAVSPGFEDGKEAEIENGGGLVKIVVREVSEAEVKAKSKEK